MTYKDEIAYKHSGVDWLGEIPSTWQVKPFWTLYRREKSTGHPDEELLSVYRDYGVIPKSSRDDNGNVESDDLNAYQLVEPDDLVMNKMKAWQGSVAVSDIRGIVSPAYFVFKPIHEAHGPYLHHLLRSKIYIGEYNRLSKGIRVGQWDLEPTAFRTTPIVLPPLEEQVTIAEFLDRETAQIDALIKKQQELIETLAERRKAVILNSVTRGLNENVELQSVDSLWLKSIPSHWKFGPLKRFAKVTLGKMVSSDAPKSDELLMPYLRAASVQPKGKIVLDETKQMAFSVRERNRFSLLKNDVVVVEGGSIGRSALIVEDLPGWCFQNSINRVRAFEGVEGEFLNWSLQAVESSGIYPMMTNAATIAHLTAEKLETVPIALPPIKEQKAISSFLSAYIQELDSLSSRSFSTIELLQERRQAIISAAVTGKIDLRGN